MNEEIKKLNKQEIIDLLINGIKRKLSEDNSVLLDFQTFDDPTLRRFQREGVYGFGNTRLPSGKTIVVAIAWDWNESEVSEKFTLEEIMDGFTAGMKLLVEDVNE